MTNLNKLLGFASVLGLWLIAACTTPPDGTVRLQEVARAVPGGDPPWQRADDAGGVRLRRGGSDEPAREIGRAHV